MQWYVKVPFFSSFRNKQISSIIIIFILNFPSSVHSSCSPYLSSINIDPHTKNHYVQPCPVSSPCQCICENENKRLWIDCFNRELKTFPIFQKIPTNNTIIQWNVDLAFNLFENYTKTKWIPNNMHIHHFVVSSSLAYDLIVQLNLTHRHLIDVWSSQQHLSITDDHDDEYESFDDEEERAIVPPHHEQTRLLNDLTSQLREKSKQIKTFALSLSGEPSSVSVLYLDHNSLDSMPIQALYNATGLYELYLSFNIISDLPAYSFGFSHRLTRLDLSYNKISSMHNLTFHRHPDAFAGPFLIDYLDLSHNQIKLLKANIFSYLVNLRLLKLEHNQIRSLSEFVWTGLYRLKYLDLSHNYLQNFTHAFYNSYLNELNHLKITSNNITHLGSCEFLSLKALNKLNLDGNNLTSLDTCSFYGLNHPTPHYPFHISLRSNYLKTLHPCTFTNFARSTIHVANNPLVCNCTFNYLLYDRKSLAYTGQECLGGFAYQAQTQFSASAMRKTSKGKGKKPVNSSITCRNTYKYYNNLCSKLDCTSLCSPNERLIIQITTIATPNKTISKFQRTFFPFLCILVKYFLCFICDI